MNEKLEKQFPPQYLAYPKGAERALPFVYQHHWRGGRSVHGDLRLSQGPFLLGFTLSVQQTGINCAALNEEDSASVSAAKACTFGRFKTRFKIDPKSGDFTRRRTAGGVVRDTQILSFPKSQQPVVWLQVEQTAPKGTVIATANLPGVMEIIDSGNYHVGARKASIWEVFFEDTKKGVFNGRYLWRPLKLEKQETLPPSEGQALPGITLNFIRPESQLPNVFADSSRKERPWVPPKGWSALPPNLKSKVPMRFRYWTKSSERDRRRLRDALFDFWKEEGIISELESGRMEKCLMDEREWHYAGGTQ